MNKEIKDKNVNNTHSIAQRWAKYECDMFHTTIFTFVGSRRLLIETMEEHFKKCGLSDGCVEEVCENICKTLPGESDTPESGDYLCINTEHYGTMHVIRLETFSPGNVDDIMVLNHECLHAALRHMQILGIRECENSPQECLCYFHENIFRTFLTKLHEGHLK